MDAFDLLIASKVSFLPSIPKIFYTKLTPNPTVKAGADICSAVPPKTCNKNENNVAFGALQCIKTILNEPLIKTKTKTLTKTIEMDENISIKNETKKIEIENDNYNGNTPSNHINTYSNITNTINISTYFNRYYIYFIIFYFTNI